MPILLVDSEAPPKPGQTSWQHLAVEDRWKKPQEVRDGQVFLMVQLMEAWFVADPDALKAFFGSGFSGNPFRNWTKPETIEKPRVLDALSTATRDCRVQFKKGKVAFEVLARIDPAKVTAACPHAKHLVDRLRSV